MTAQFRGSTIGDIVASDFRTAAVFEHFGIDFCCGGRRSLAEACRAASADEGAVVQALTALPAPVPGVDDVAEWPLDRLVDHIVDTHHAYIRSAVPTIAAYLTKLDTVHGARHPELRQIEDVFGRLSHELGLHMMKEEQILFPYVCDLAELPVARRDAVVSPFGSVANPIRMMEHEHDEAGEALRQIRALTSDYMAPADGCTTYQVCMQELKRFELDLHRHIHLENNVLFPRAVALESGVTVP
jgi:regulator of cell morphogenesis and NO signaling